MSSLDALIGTGAYAKELGGVAASPSAFVEATIATTPATVTDEVMVLVGAEDSQLQAGPCRWEPRPNGGFWLLPQRGDPCLVVAGDQGHRAIVWWKPKTTPAPDPGVPGPQGVRGSLWTSTNRAPTGADAGNAGDEWLNTATGDVYQRGSSSWVLTGNIRGLQGSQGPAGATGPAGTPLPRVTSLTAGVGGMPATISDGTEVAYVADAANGVLWHLKYNAGSASAYKWELVGGSDLEDEALVRVTKASMPTATYGPVDASDPTLTLPLAGDYLVRSVAALIPATAVAVVSLGVKVGATEPVINVNAAVGFASAAGAPVTMAQERRLAGMAAGTVIAQRYYQNQAAQNVDRVAASLTAKPVRVG